MRANLPLELIKMYYRPFLKYAVLAFGLSLSLSSVAAEHIKLTRGSRLVLLGNGPGSRMVMFGHFETELQIRDVGGQLFIRNICDEGNTPGFRPHSGRSSPWAFPGAEKYRPPPADLLKFHPD